MEPKVREQPHSAVGAYQGRYLVVGPPGCGKTTFLARQARAIVERYSGAFTARRWPTPVLICSLTRAAAAEVAGRDLPIKPHCVGTLHAHCYRALNGPKIVASASVQEWNEARPEYEIGGLSGVDDGFEPDDFRPSRPGDALLQRVDVLRHRQTPLDRWPRESREFFDDWCAWKSEKGLMDFTDLIEECYVGVGAAPGDPAVMLVDEAQDLSSLEYGLVCKWGERCEAVIVVGDPAQALYAWRGARLDIFDDPGVPSEKRRVLSQSYRVPRRVLEVARGWLEREYVGYRPVEYRPTPADGVVEVMESARSSSPDDVVEEAERCWKAGESVIIQASCSYMLAATLSGLRARGVPFSNPWRSHRGDWNPLRSARGLSMCARMAAFMRPYAEDGGVWSARDLAVFGAVMQSDGVMRRGAKAAIEARLKVRDEDERAEEQDWRVCASAWFVDEVAAYLEDVAAMRPSERDAASWYWQRMLGRQKKSAEFALSIVEKQCAAALLDPPRIHVGSCHSFKGAESDVVFVYPDVSAAGAREWGSSEGKNGVVRLFYVAMTRARKRLVVCSPSGQDCVPLRRHVREYLAKEKANGEAAVDGKA